MFKQLCISSLLILFGITVCSCSDSDSVASDVCENYPSIETSEYVLPFPVGKS